MLRDVAEADIVIAGYALTEMANNYLPAVLQELWRLTRGLLVIVEPGTPQGLGRILTCRDHLIGCGGHIVAPCTHAAACPLSSASRWCHFSERLPRSRTHLFAKEGNLSYEDEKFSFLAVAKDKPAQQPYRRILCDAACHERPDFIGPLRPRESRSASFRRDKEACKAAKNYAWGDAVEL